MTILSAFDEWRLLIIDLDGILVNDHPPGKEALNEASDGVRDTLVLVYVSGRTLNEQVAAISEYELLLPDYVVSGVGGYADPPHAGRASLG